MNLKDKIVTYISYLLHSEKRSLIRLARKCKDKTGLEIGGPSAFFSERSYFPVYLFAKCIDGVNFSNNTVWEGNIKEGKNYIYLKNKRGYQYISETNNLSAIESNKYDFIASCHCLEHAANPLKVLLEWKRLLKQNAYLVLVLPDKNYTFDENRPYTFFEHLKNDFENETDETDTTHFHEIIKLHNLEKDDGVKTITELTERTNNNFFNRCVHHHVFNFETINEMLDYTGYSVIYQQQVKPFHLVTIAQRF